jgi:hypothetical protein
VEVNVVLQAPRRLLVAVAFAAACAPALTGLPGAQAASAAKPVHPGVEVNFGEVSCEVGAVMHQGKTVYLAVPASCGGIDAGKVQPAGCYGPNSPTGVPASIVGAKHNGTLVYDSFTEMQSQGVTAHDRCTYNDLALIRVNHLDRHLVSSSIPGTGAPRGVSSSLPKSGTTLRFGTNSATAGATSHSGWTVTATTMAMLKTANVGAPVTVGNQLVGMLIVLPAGPIPNVPLLQNPGQVYNLAYAIKELHRIHHFRHVTLVRAGQHV